MKEKAKYCKGCGGRLQEADGAYWRFAGRCVWCRLKAAFAAHGVVYKGGD